MNYALVYINSETNNVHQVYLKKEHQLYLEALINMGMFGNHLIANEKPLGKINKEG